MSTVSRGDLFCIPPPVFLDPPHPFFPNCCPFYFGNVPKFPSCVFNSLPLPSPGLLTVLSEQTVPIQSALHTAGQFLCEKTDPYLTLFCSEVTAITIASLKKVKLLGQHLRSWDLTQNLGFWFFVLF